MWIELIEPDADGYHGTVHVITLRTAEDIATARELMGHLRIVAAPVWGHEGPPMLLIRDGGAALVFLWPDRPDNWPSDGLREGAIWPDDDLPVDTEPPDLDGVVDDVLPW